MGIGRGERSGVPAGKGVSGKGEDGASAHIGSQVACLGGGGDVRRGGRRKEERVTVRVAW